MSLSIDISYDLFTTVAHNLLSHPAQPEANDGGTVATVGFPNIGLQGFAPKLAP